MSAVVSPRAPLQRWTFRLRRAQWVDIRSIDGGWSDRAPDGAQVAEAGPWR